MVNFIVVSGYSGPPEPGDRVKIDGGPLYELASVQALVGDPSRIQLWTRKCIQDVANLNWDVTNVAELIGDLNVGNHYRDSEWCNNGGRTWAACDTYVIRRREWIPAVHKEMVIEYFLKFAIGKTGSLVLTVSCHT